MKQPDDRCPQCNLVWITMAYDKEEGPFYFFRCGVGHKWSRLLTFPEHGEIKTNEKKFNQYLSDKKKKPNQEA